MSALSSKFFVPLYSHQTRFPRTPISTTFEPYLLLDVAWSFSMATPPLVLKLSPSAKSSSLPPPIDSSIAQPNSQDVSLPKTHPMTTRSQKNIPKSNQKYSFHTLVPPWNVSLLVLSLPFVTLS